jgi:hypothetical protein
MLPIATGVPAWNPHALWRLGDPSSMDLLEPECVWIIERL